MEKKYKISNLNKGLFKAYMKTKTENIDEGRDIDIRFINNISKLTEKEFVKIMEELNDIDYEVTYIPKSINKWRKLQILIDKYERLYEIMKDLVKKI